MATQRKDINFTYPAHDIPLAQKGREWHMSWCRAIHGNFVGSDQRNWFYNNNAYYQYLRRYALGKQDTGKYKDQVDCTDAKQKSLNDLNWSIIPILPKFLGIIKSKIIKTGFEFNLKRIDSIGVNEKRDMKSSMQAALALQDFLQGIQDFTGVQVAEQQPEDAPKDTDELEFHLEYEYKDKLTIAYENALKLETEANRFNMIRDRWADDILDVGVAGYKTYTDTNGNPRIRYAKPDNLIVSNVEMKDFSDMVFCGEIRWLTFDELLKEAGNDLSKAEKEELGQKFVHNVGVGTNLPYDFWATEEQYRRGIQQRAEQRIQVIDCEWYSIDDFFETETEMTEKEPQQEKNMQNTSPTDMTKGIDLGKTEEGNEKEKSENDRAEKAHEKSESAREENGEKKTDNERKPTKVRTIHKGTLVLGTDIIYKWGLLNDMVRAANNPEETKLSYHLYAPLMKGSVITSLCEILVPLADQIQLTFLKMQQAIQAINPNQVAIDLAAIMDLALDYGGRKITPMEVIELFFKKGVGIYDSSNIAKNLNAGKPFQELQSRVAETAGGFSSILNMWVDLIRQVTGVNEVTDASTPNSKLLVGTANTAIAATNDALFAYFTADEECCVSMAKDLVERITMNIKYYGGKRYIESMGDDTVRFLKDNADQPLPAFGIVIEKQMTKEERDIVLTMAKESIAAGQLDMSDFYAIQNCYSTKQAQALMTVRLKRKEKKMMKMQEQQMQQNAQVQQQSAQAAEQAKVQAAQMLLETELAKEAKLSELRMAEMEKEYELKGKLELLQRQTALIVTATKGEIDKDIAEDKIEGDLLKVDMQGKYDTALHRETLQQKEKESKEKTKE